MRFLCFLSICLVSTCLLVFVANSRADLIEVDIFSAGDGLLTRDTNTNLDWLDLTVSQGFTYNDIIGGAGNFLASGFTHASNSVVGTFLTNAGLPTITTTFTADAFGPAMTLQALVGITRDEGGDSPFSQGIKFHSYRWTYLTLCNNSYIRQHRFQVSFKNRPGRR